MELMKGGCLEDYLHDNVRVLFRDSLGNHTANAAEIREGDRGRDAVSPQLQHHP